MGLSEVVSERQRERSAALELCHDRLNKLAQDNQQLWSEIVALSFTQLQESLQREEYSCVQVLAAYQWHMLAVHDRTNAVTQLLPTAHLEATALDAKYAGTKDKPKMFGIPISLKELLEVSGSDTTFGFIHRVNNPIMDRDALCVRLLKQAGAVPFVRTNIPQAMVSFNCSNPLYGLTTHPLNSSLTPGGSSGGEGALIGAGGSLVGLGSDGGGSIRIPSCFCGIVGIKPTSTRLSQLGVGVNLPGSVVLGITWGPMAKDVSALTAVLDSVLTEQMGEEDPYTVVHPLNHSIINSTRPLRIAYYDYDGWTDALPMMTRVVNDTKLMLQAQGHTLVSWQPPRAQHGLELFMRTFLPDGGTELLRWLSKDIKDKYNKNFFTLLWLPEWLKQTLSVLTRPFFPRLSIMAGCPAANTDQLRAAYADILSYRKEFVREWRSQQLDVLICPPVAHPACTHELPDKCGVGAFYSALYNVLDFPAGSVPVSTINKQDVLDVQEQFVASDQYSKMIAAEFDDDRAIGLPIGVQVVALPNQDELCLRLMNIIQQHTLHQSD